MIDPNMYCRPSDTDSSESSTDHRIPPIPKPRRRRRYLDDPIVSPASNYYVIDPSLDSTPAPLPRHYSKLNRQDDIFCDLFNLLERTPPPIKPRKKYLFNDRTPPRPQRSIDSILQRKSFEEKEQYASIEHHHYQRLYDKNKTHRCHYVARKGFFKRVAEHYFCLPITVSKAEF